MATTGRSDIPGSWSPPSRTASSASSLTARPSCSASTASPISLPLHSRQNNDEVQLYAFDILALDGEDLRSLPLSMRKTNLARLLARRPDGIFVAPSVALKTLGPYIEDATHLQTGK